MPMVRAMRLLADIEAGNLSGAQLETLLTTDASRLAEFNVLLTMRSHVRRMVDSAAGILAILESGTAFSALLESGTAFSALLESPVVNTVANELAESAAAMSLIAASSAAMAIVVASDALMAAVAASSVGMAAVAASSLAMNAVAASNTAMQLITAATAAKMAIFGSDVALNIIAGSAVALTALRASPQYVVRQHATFAQSAIVLPNAPAAGGSYIALGVSTSNATNGRVLTINTRRSGSAVAITTTSDGTGFAATALKYPKALPLVAPFTAGDGAGSTWFIGMLRCDV